MTEFAELKADQVIKVTLNVAGNEMTRFCTVLATNPDTRKILVRRDNHTFTIRMDDVVEMKVVSAEPYRGYINAAR